MLVRFDYPRTLDNLIEDFFITDSVTSPYIFPAVDIAEEGNEIKVVAELPGVKKEDIKISVENNVLTLSGQRKPYEIPENAKVLLNEVRVRDFNRSIQFECDIEVDKTSAELTDGVLRIVLPKAESTKVRTIDVK